MDSQSSKVFVTIHRENRSAYSARKIRVIVDGKEEVAIDNGSCVRLCVKQGNHQFAFAIGKCIYSSISVDVQDDMNVVCATKTSGVIEARVVNRDVAFEASQKKRSPLLLRVLIAIPVIIILFYLVSQSTGSFLN